MIARRQIIAAEAIISAQLLITPKDPTWITLLAEVRIDQGQPAQAVKFLEKANQIGGVTAQRSLMAAFAQSVWGHPALAEQQFRIAIRLAPANPLQHYFLARVLYNQLRFDEAIRESRKTIALAPEFIEAYDNIGLCYEGEYKPEEAKRWYLKAIEMNRASSQKTEWPDTDLAGMLIRQNHVAEAKQYLDEAVAINPQNPQALFQTGLFLKSKNDLNGALRAFEAALRADPQMETAYYQAAWISREFGRENQAAEYFDKFQQIHDRTQGLKRSWYGKEPAAY